MTTYVLNTVLKNLTQYNIYITTQYVKVNEANECEMRIQCSNIKGAAIPIYNGVDLWYII